MPWKIGTWNISRNGKERAIEMDFESVSLEILRLLETKKKRKGALELRKGRMLTYSGLEMPRGQLQVYDASYIRIY